MKERCKSFSRYQAIYVPRCNCKACWEKYFFAHVGEVVTAEYGLQKFGDRSVHVVRGEKYLKMLKWFLQEHGSALEAYEQYRQEQEAAGAEPVSPEEGRLERPDKPSESAQSAEPSESGEPLLAG